MESKKCQYVFISHDHQQHQCEHEPITHEKYCSKHIKYFPIKACVKPDDDEILEEYLIFTGKLDLIGHVTKKGVELIDYIVDGRINEDDDCGDGTIWDKFDAIIYKGMFHGKLVAVKLDYNQLRSSKSQTTDILTKFAEHDIPMYNWFLDSLNGINIDIDLIVTDMLSPLTKVDAIPMLKAIIPVCFKYQSFMVHADIKPDNIMCRRESEKGEGMGTEYFLIDFDSVSTEHLMYGYVRTSRTPLFATQNLVALPTIITLRHDIIELILSASAIYYGMTEINKYGSQTMIWKPERFSINKIFSTLYLCALNIDDRYITENDEKLLLHILELTTNVYNKHPLINLFIDKLSHIQDMIVTYYYTNTQIMEFVFKE